MSLKICEGGRSSTRLHCFWILLKELRNIQEKPQSDQPVSRLRFENETYKNMRNANLDTFLIRSAGLFNRSVIIKQATQQLHLTEWRTPTRLCYTRSACEVLPDSDQASWVEHSTAETGHWRLLIPLSSMRGMLPPSICNCTVEQTTRKLRVKGKKARRLLVFADVHRNLTAEADKSEASFFNATGLALAQNEKQQRSLPRTAWSSRLNDVSLCLYGNKKHIGCHLY